MPEQKKLVSVDTEILIWGIQKKANPKELQKIMIPKADYFFSNYLNKNKLVLIIPSIVVGEYLVKITKNEKQIFSEFLEKCLVVPYDLKASLIAAEIWSKRKNIDDELDRSRHCITADCKIIATAKAHGASEIYTEHSDIINLARLINFPTIPLPEVPREQLTIDFDSMNET